MSSGFKLNFKSSPRDDRDYRLVYDVSKASALPLSVDLSSRCTSIKNQGDVGSCTAHAAIAMYEFIYKNSVPDTTMDIFSEKFTYYTTRVNVAGWSASEDSGAYVRDALRSLVKYGTCKEATFPYLKAGQTSSDFKELPPPTAYTEALKYQALTYVNIPDGTDSLTRQKSLTTLKGILDGGNVFIGGFICYDNMHSSVNGLIPNPVATSKTIGGHAICFVGYDDVRQVFKFKNSWGSTWGDHGYGYLPYQYLLTGSMFDMWSIIRAENDNSAIQIIKPIPTRRERITDIINNGLIAIGNGQTPVVPVSLSTIDANAVRSLFNRITAMRNQTIGTK